MDLAGKTAIVTGASSGIGAATVRKLREAGVRVAGGARRVERVEADIALQLDVTDEESARGVRRGGGRRARRRSTSSSTTPAWRSAAHRSRSRPRTTRRRVAAHERRRRPPDHAARAAAHPRRGHIVFMGSIAGRQAYPNGGLVHRLQVRRARVRYALREDLLGRPIRITTVDAGLVETEFSLVRFKGDEAKATPSTKASTRHARTRSPTACSSRSRGRRT